MKAKTLFDIIPINTILQVWGDLELCEVRSLQIDSRKIGPGDAFIALRGTSSDGHLHISAAIASGAVLIICEVMPAELKDGVVYVAVQDLRSSYGFLAHQFYGNPSERMTVVGVTGTNGKTTIATLCHQLFSALGFRCGLISTVANCIGDRWQASTHTTPDAISIASLMAEMRSDGCTHVFMEVSSHAIDQCRIAGIQFRAGIFSNITHDHLDYHKTFKAYIQAKKALFDQLPASAVAITNVDDKNGMVMVQNTRAKIIKYSLRGAGDHNARILADQLSGLHLRIDGREVIVKLTGAFNAANLLAVYAVAKDLGLEEVDILTGLSSISGPEGRMERVTATNQGIFGVVDYAHTPDALENVLQTLVKSKQPQAKLIAVFGCGGNRDKEKRPEMAKIAVRFADQVILTSDNPRFESPESILDDMEVGVADTLKMKVLRITDRRAAIKTAVTLAKKGDIILLAGKGHEKYQEINGEKFPFDDKAILAEYLGVDGQR